jgi:hypothetical protein
MNLKPVHDAMHSLITTAAEILYLTRVELVMGTHDLPQAEPYWSVLSHLPLKC